MANSTNGVEAKQEHWTRWMWNVVATYNIDFGVNHFDILGGIELNREDDVWFSGYKSGYSILTPDYMWPDAGSGTALAYGSGTGYSLVSFFGKANYSYDNRYLLGLTLRHDGSSRFGKHNRYATFPSVSFGWRISQENFMEDTRSWLSDLKLRGAWGINGNDIIDNEAFYTKYLMSLQAASYNMTGDNSTLASGAFKTRSTNPDLRWERTKQTNVGFDASVLNGRLMFTLDYFYKHTKDMLVEKPYIAVIGEGGYCWYNGGEMTNRGVEFQADWRSRAGKVDYNIGFNVTVMKNKVTALLDDIYYTYGGGNGIDKSLVGQSLGSWMGYKTDGVFHSQAEVDEYCQKYNVQFGRPEVGRLRYVDTNNDGVISTSDRTWLGCDLPKASFGLNLGANWNGFDASMFFSAIIRDAFNNSKYYTDFFQLWTGNHSTRLLEAAEAYDKYLTSGFYDSEIPAPTTNNSNNEHELSQYYIENGSFLRLKTLTVGYTLPNAIMSKLRLNSARLYFQAQNLFTITKYTGADPEGLGYPYALPRSFTFGIQFGF